MGEDEGEVGGVGLEGDVLTCGGRGEAGVVGTEEDGLWGDRRGVCQWRGGG